ncbi:MAG: hypothetical protein R3D70_05645 [Rhizobiaceae bacterium]
MKRSPILKTLFATTVLVCASSAWAMAQDISAVGERLKAVMEDQGMTISWTSQSGDASEMTLDGVKIGVTGSPGEFTLGTMTLSDITEDNGAYTIGTVSVPDYIVTEKEATISVSGLEMSGVKLSASDDSGPLARLLMYETADVAKLTVTRAGTEIFAVNGTHIEATEPTAGNPLTFSLSTDGFNADLSGIEDPKSKAVLQALGYEKITGNIEMDGSWQPTDGRMTLSSYDMTVDNAGTLGLTFDLGGYTPDFIKSMQDMQKKMASQPAGADNSAQGLAMLGMMQQLTFHTASIRFDDDSLTTKVLDFVANMQGVQPSDIANQAKAIVPIMMAQVIQDQALIKNVSEALTTFLDDPKSLEINAAPAQPVPFALIAAGAMSAPQELPKTLGVTVTAND